MTPDRLGNVYELDTSIWGNCCEESAVWRQDWALDTFAVIEDQHGSLLGAGNHAQQVSGSKRCGVYWNETRISLFSDMLFFHFTSLVKDGSSPMRRIIGLSTACHLRLWCPQSFAGMFQAETRRGLMTRNARSRGISAQSWRCLRRQRTAKGRM